MPIDLWLPPKPAIIRPAPSSRLAMPFAPGFRGRGGATCAFLQAETPQLSGVATYTFTSVNIGTASADRYVVVVVSNGVTTVGRTLNSVSIGGNAATLHVNSRIESGGNDVIIGIAGLLVTSGTSANVVVTFSGNMNTCYCRTYALRRLHSTTPTTPKATTLASGTVISDTINIPAHGILIFGAQALTSTGSYTMAGATEDADQNTNNLPSATASSQGMAAETARAYSATISANTPILAMAAAAWN